MAYCSNGNSPVAGEPFCRAGATDQDAEIGAKWIPQMETVHRPYFDICRDGIEKHTDVAPGLACRAQSIEETRGSTLR